MSFTTEKKNSLINRYIMREYTKFFSNIVVCYMARTSGRLISFKLSKRNSTKRNRHRRETKQYIKKGAMCGALDRHYSAETFFFISIKIPNFDL